MTSKNENVSGKLLSQELSRSAGVCAWTSKGEVFHDICILVSPPRGDRGDEDELHKEPRFGLMKLELRGEM